MAKDYVLTRLWQTYVLGKFFNKLLLTIIMIVLLSMMALTLVISFNITTTLQEKEFNLNTHIINNIGSYFLVRKQSAMNIAKSFYLMGEHSDTRPFRMIESGKQMDLIEFAQAKRNLDSFMTKSVFDDNDITDMLIHSYSMDTVFLAERIQEGIIGTIEPGLIAKIEDQVAVQGGFRLLPSHIRTYGSDEETGYVYTMGITIVNESFDRPLGVMLIDFNPESVDESYKEYMDELKGYIIVTDEKGDVIYDSSGRYYGKTYPYMRQLRETAGRGTAKMEEESFLNVKQGVLPGIIIAGVIPKRDMMASVSNLKRSLYVIAAICIAASLLLHYIGISVFSRRIKALNFAMRRLRGGDFAYRIPINKINDEIGEMARNFNLTIAEMNDYINKVYVLSLKQKTAEIRSLQSQITPQFLYNTLEAIRMKAVADGNEEVGEMTWIVSMLFRNSISMDTIVDFTEEIEQCELYLDLFKIRYYDRLSVTIEIASNIMSSAVVKHTLQPTIENYILHGFDNRREDNEIRIRGCEEDGIIKVEIGDNGRGIDAERLSALRESLLSLGPPIHQKSGVGLRNVNDRIKLIFGMEYGMSIESGMGEGTTVRLQWPKRSRKELQEDVQGIDRG